MSKYLKNIVKNVQQSVRTNTKKIILGISIVGVMLSGVATFTILNSSPNKQSSAAAVCPSGYNYVGTQCEQRVAKVPFVDSKCTRGTRTSINTCTGNQFEEIGNNAFCRANQYMIQVISTICVPNQYPGFSMNTSFSASCPANTDSVASPLCVPISYRYSESAVCPISNFALRSDQQCENIANNVQRYINIGQRIPAASSHVQHKITLDYAPSGLYSIPVVTGNTIKFSTCQKITNPTTVVNFYTRAWDSTINPDPGCGAIATNQGGTWSNFSSNTSIYSDTQNLQFQITVNNTATQSFNFYQKSWGINGGSSGYTGCTSFDPVIPNNGDVYCRWNTTNSVASTSSNIIVTIGQKYDCQTGYTFNNNVPTSPCVRYTTPLSFNCPAGQYLSNPNTDSCTTCPINNYCTGGTGAAKTPCPTDTSSPVGSTSSTACTQNPCTNGATNPPTCNNCPAGQYFSNSNCLYLQKAGIDYREFISGTNGEAGMWQTQYKTNNGNSYNAFKCDDIKDILDPDHLTFDDKNYLAVKETCNKTKQDAITSGIANPRIFFYGFIYKQVNSRTNTVKYYSFVYTSYFDNNGNFVNWYSQLKKDDPSSTGYIIYDSAFNKIG